MPIMPNVKGNTQLKVSLKLPYTISVCFGTLERKAISFSFSVAIGNTREWLSEAWQTFKGANKDTKMSEGPRACIIFCFALIHYA